MRAPGNVIARKLAERGPATSLGMAAPVAKMGRLASPFLSQVPAAGRGAARRPATD